MWNCDWEYANQETLKQWYEEKISGWKPDLAVRKIICKGCGRAFYTQIASENDESYKSPMDVVFEALEERNPEHIAVKQYKVFKQAAGKTAKSDLQELRKGLHAEAVGCGLLLQRLPPAGLSSGRYR